MGTLVGIAICAGNKRAVANAPSEVEPTGIMTFADPAMQALCAKTWGDGTNITYEQAREVTEIPSKWAKGNTTITSFNEIKYFKNLTKIGTFAFQNCSSMALTKLELPQCTSIGEAAFERCSSMALTKLELPQCTSIGNYAFNGCSSMALTKLELLQCKTIGNQAFYGCTSIAIEDLYLPNLTSLGSNAFYGAKIKKISNLGSIKTLPMASGTNGTLGDKSTLEEVVLPETLTSIGTNSINGYTNLTSIGSGVFPNLTTIGYNCFYNIPNVAQAVSFPTLTSVSSTSGAGNHDTLTKCGFTEFHAPLLDLANTDVSQQGHGLFLGCTNLRVLEIGKLTVVPFGFASGCTSLEDVSDLSKVTSVKKMAFRNTPSLRIHLKLPVCTNVLADTTNSNDETFYKSGILSLDAPMLMEIGTGISSSNSKGAFQGCANLTLVKLRDVTKIGINAFYKCPNLSKVIIDNETPPTLGSYAFVSCSSELAFYVPDESVEAYKTATNWNAFADIILPLSQYNG